MTPRPPRRVLQHGFAATCLKPLALHGPDFTPLTPTITCEPESCLLLRMREAAMVVIMSEDVAGTNIIFTIREVTDKTPSCCRQSRLRGHDQGAPMA